MKVPPAEQSYAQAVELGKKVWLCGGWRDYDDDKLSSDIYEYDTEEEEWSECRMCMPMGLGGHCMLEMRIV